MKYFYQIKLHLRRYILTICKLFMFINHVTIAWQLIVNHYEINRLLLARYYVLEKHDS